MITLESLEIVLSIDENALLRAIGRTGGDASGHAAAGGFFEKYPGLKSALLNDLPDWKEALKQRLHNTQAPPELETEFGCYQRAQAADSQAFHARLPRIMEMLNQVESPF